MRYLGIPILGFVAIFAIHPSFAHAATAAATDVYPATTVPMGVRVSFIVTGSGFSGRPTYKVVDSFPGGVTTVNIDAGGNFAWTPNSSDIGSHTITVTLTDSEGTTAETSKTVTVVSAPTVSIGDVSPASAVAIGTTISFPVTTSALFSPTFTVSDPTPSSTAHGKSLVGTTFSWTPISQDAGTHTITVTAKDSFGSEASDSVDIVVLGPASIATSHLSPGTSVHANQTLTFDMSSEGFVSPWYGITDDLTTQSTSSIMIAGSKATWTPYAEDVGVHPLRIGAHDSGGRAATTTLTITVTEALPVANNAASSPSAPTSSASPTSQSASSKPPASVLPRTPKTTQNGSAKPAAPPTTHATDSRTSDAPIPGASTTLAYPTPAAGPERIEASEQAPDFPVVVPAPTFGEYMWNNIDAFFSVLLGLFGR